MELILLENIKNLGTLGKVIKVKPGFARNYLLPKGKAVLANKENLRYFEERQEELKSNELNRIKQLQQRFEILNGMQIKLAMLASEEGKLYGSIGVNDIAEAIAAAGGEVKKKEILLPHSGIRELGTYEIQLGLNNNEMVASIQLLLVAKEKSQINSGK